MNCSICGSPHCFADYHTNRSNDQMMSKDVFGTIAGLNVYRLASSNIPVVRVDDLLNWIQQRGATCSEELEEGIIDYQEEL